MKYRLGKYMIVQRSQFTNWSVSCRVFNVVMFELKYFFLKFNCLAQQTH